MTQQIINVGSVPNDGTGDQLRSAGLKINANFTELYTRAPGGLSGLLAADNSTGYYRVAVVADISFAGTANGLATLDGSGKVPTAQLPAALVGAMDYQGTWNANTNSPALASGTGTKGFYYKVSVAGTTTLDGINDWQIGDWAVFNGTTWDKIDNTDLVSSVAGLVGAISAASLKSALAIAYTDVSGFGTVVTYNVGTGANNIVKLDGSAKLPAVDGSQLTNLPMAVVPSGFVNVLRNASMAAWFHGTSGTVTTSGGWTAEGIYAVPTGASVTWFQASAFAGCLTPSALTVTGATSVTGLKLRFVVESYDVAKLAGKICTFQLQLVNNTGGTITPQISTKFPTAQDNWSGSTADLSATSMQAVSNGATATLAYAFTMSASATNGYEIIVDLGNNFSTSGKSVTIGGGFDLRATPTATVGLIASPPTPEIRSAQTDFAWCERYIQATYDNGVAPASATNVGLVQLYTYYYVGGWYAIYVSVPFRTRMRVAPTLSQWDNTGAAGAFAFQGIGQTGFQALAPGAAGGAFHYLADASLTGA
jgi:hypothetical protein